MNVDNKSYYFRRSSGGGTGSTSRTPGLNWTVGSYHEIEFYLYFDYTQ